jgi:hypothetical protein
MHDGIMNTSAHAVINLVILGRKGRFDGILPILAGAVLPDLPAFLFYVYEKVILNVPENVIWTHDYFRADWQAVFDLLHSFPILGVCFVLSALSRSTLLSLLFGSMFLHALEDFPLHHDDAHRHFFPLSA